MQADLRSEEAVRSERGRTWWAVAGGVAAGSALAAGELAAGLVSALPSLVGGVATLVIDSVPEPVKALAIDLFGTNDKLALGVGIVVVAVLLGVLAGRAWGRRAAAMAGLFAGFGVAGALAAARTPEADLVPALLTAGVATLAGVTVHLFLADRVPAHTDSGRRAFLAWAGSIAGLALLGGLAGQVLIERSRRVVAGREGISLPDPVEAAPPPPPEASLAVPGITPLITPNEDFYRIDTVPFSVPRVDPATWRVRVTGMVEREVSLGLSELTSMPMVERYITLSCVSNEVGGNLVGNAKWLGVPLRDVLDLAGVREGAEQIVGRSVDGFTVGFPVEAAFDGRDALVAVGMNSEPLPLEHGFPARLVVAGLYGYVSATKWLAEIELTTWDGFDAYWVPRGWAKEGPVKTQSRIDTPRPGSSITAGTHAIAGVAWAPNRGISRVEVAIDGGGWREAELAAALSEDTWRQWRLVWEAVPGDHVIQVRATDGTGETQTAGIAPPAPDGASGYHTVLVSVA